MRPVSGTRLGCLYKSVRITAKLAASSRSGDLFTAILEAENIVCRDLSALLDVPGLGGRATLLEVEVWRAADSEGGCLGLLLSRIAIQWGS